MVIWLAWSPDDNAVTSSAKDALLFAAREFLSGCKIG
jgi:hypothetical protein